MAKKYTVANKNAASKRYKVKASENVYDDIARKKGEKYRRQFPKEYPFWARLKISKNRTVLVIDDEVIEDKKKSKTKSDNREPRRVLGFVHREATSSPNKRFEKIEPNPDKDKKEAMYLKSPDKKPIQLFKPHNKKLDMPKKLQKRYEKNNKKRRK